MLDAVASIVSAHLDVFGLQMPGGRYMHLTPAQIAKGCFVDGARRFVIESDGVEYWALRVRRRRRPAYLRNNLRAG